jgi:hypothetical protein
LRLSILRRELGELFTGGSIENKISTENFLDFRGYKIISPLCWGDFNLTS